MIKIIRSFAAALLLTTAAACSGGEGGESNTPPVAIDDTATTDEDTAVSIDVLSNDTDGDGDEIVVSGFTEAANGTVTVLADGTIGYLPDDGFNGSDTFTYTLSDARPETAMATVTVTVTAVGDAPIGLADSYAATEDTVLTVTALSGVLGNDVDTDSTAVTAVVSNGPATGTLALAADGSFTYTPAANANGNVTFTYHVNDGALDSAATTVTIALAAVNDAPTAANDASTVAEDGVLTVAAAAGVLANDADVDGNPLYTELVTSPASGSISLAGDGSFLYVPNANFNGSDSFTYRATDGTLDSAVATVALTVTAANDAPVAAADSYGATEDTALNVAAAAGVLANDSDIDSTMSAVLVTPPATGTLALNADGSFLYTPAQHATGSVTFTYRATDSALQSAITTVTITIAAVNDAPVAVNDTYSSTEDTSLTGTSVLANDTDVEGSTLFAELVTPPASGTLSLHANGTFTYLPAANVNGAVTFVYRATDGVANSGDATATINLSAQNDAPVAVADSGTTAEEVALVVAAPGVLSNDSDVDSAPLTAVLGTGPSNGSLTLGTNGSYTYTPNAHFNGSDSFTYRATDGALQSALTTVSLTVSAVNDAPVAVADTRATSEDTPLAGATVLSNDTDVESSPLFAELATGPSNGTLALAGDGTFTYTPNANFNGADSFTYRATDGILDSAPATVTINVSAANDTPVAGNDAYTTQEDTALVVAASGVLSNDSDVESAVTVTAVTNPANGGLVTAANGSFTYTPNANFNGTDSWTYRATDGALPSAIATVTITVLPVNDAPSFTGSNVTRAEDSGASTIANWAGSISAGPGETGQTLTFEAIAGDPSAFAAAPAVSATGTLTFTPAANVFGSFPVTVSLLDDGGTPSDSMDDRRSAAQVFTITLTGVNDPPTLVLGGNRTVDEDSGFFDEPGYAAIAAGPYGETGSVSVFASFDNGFLFEFDCDFPNCGQPTVDFNGRLSFNLAADAAGTSNITVFVEDTFGSTVQQSLVLTVTNVNDAPSFTAGPDQASLSTDGTRTVPNWATGISAGNGDVGQSVGFTAVADDTTLFSTQPTVDASGTLTYTPSGSFGIAMVTVTATDDGVPPLSSAPHVLMISIQDPGQPPSLLSSSIDGTPALSFDEAFGGGGGQLNPALFVFDDPNLVCDASTPVIDVNGVERGVFVEGTDFTRDCSTAGQLRIFVSSYATGQDGEYVTVDLTGIVDDLGNAGANVFRDFVYDSQSPNFPVFIDDVSFGGCRAVNTRAIARFDEPMDPLSSGDFRFDSFGSGTAVPVTVEPDDLANGYRGSGWGSVEQSNDTFFFVPRDLLGGGNYEIDLSGFADAAGNFAFAGTQSFFVCGQGDGGGPAPSFRVDQVAFVDASSTIETIDDSEIVNGFALAGSAIRGTDADLEVVFTENLQGGSSNGNLNVNSDNGGGGASFFATVSGNRLVFQPSSDPSFTWGEAGTRYDVSYNACSTSGFDCTSSSFEVVVQNAGDGITPRLVATSGKRASASDAGRPLLRPYEALRVGFSEELDRRTIVAANFALTDGSGNFVPVTFVDEDGGGLGAVSVLVRADDGTGRPGAFSTGVHTLVVSGIQDLGEPQNTLPTTTVQFEVGMLGNTPSFVGSTPADGDDLLSAQAGRIFLSFDDAMARSSFVDTGAGLRAFRLEEGISGATGSVFVPLKGFRPQDVGGFGGGGEPLGREPEIIALGVEGFGGGGGDIGLRDERTYRFSLLADALNADGVGLGGVGPQITFDTVDPSSGDTRPTISSFRFEGQIFPSGSFTFQGSPLASGADLRLELSDPDVGTGDQETFTFSAPLDSRTFGPNGTTNFNEQLSEADVAALFNSSATNPASFDVEDDNANASSIQMSAYLMGPLGAPAVSVSGGTVTISGTIAAPDAAFVEYVAIGIFVTDESGAVPNIVEFPFSAMAQASRDAAGELSWEFEADYLTLPPVSAPLAYRAVAMAAVPAPVGAGGDGFQIFSPLTATFVPPFTGEIFFSEYVEGSASNKAVEIRNPSSTPFDLTGCSVSVSFNGGSSTAVIPLTATVAANDVWVVCHSSAGVVLGPKCDQLTGSLNFNGDDALSLVCNGSTLDVIGQVGTDPGATWGTPPTRTLDTTLRRHCGIIDGDEDGTDAFDPATEWGGFAMDDFDDVGLAGCAEPPVTITGTTTNDGGQIVAGALVEIVETGESTTSDVAGNWSITTAGNALVWVRVTQASRYGYATLVRTANGVTVNAFLIDDMQGYYTSLGAPNPVDPAAGSVYLADPFTPGWSSNLGTATSDGSAPFPTEDDRLYFNVSVGTSTITIDGPSGACSVPTGPASSVTSPFTLRVDPNVLTVLEPDC